MKLYGLVGNKWKIIAQNVFNEKKKFSKFYGKIINEWKVQNNITLLVLKGFGYAVIDENDTFY